MGGAAVTVANGEEGRAEMKRAVIELSGNALKVLQRPFDGQYPVYNLFDHDFPTSGEIHPYTDGDSELTYCGIEALGLLADQLGLEGGVWAVVSSMNDDIANLGFGVIGVFILAWGFSAVVYRWKNYDRLAPVQALPPMLIDHSSR